MVYRSRVWQLLVGTGRGVKGRGKEKGREKRKQEGKGYGGYKGYSPPIIPPTHIPHPYSYPSIRRPRVYADNPPILFPGMEWYWIPKGKRKRRK
jgi:hypothetical protein